MKSILWAKLDMRILQRLALKCQNVPCFFFLLFFLCLWVCEAKPKDPIEGVDVNCQINQSQGIPGAGIPEWGIENNACELQLLVPPQLPRGFRATFIDALSRLSWNSLRQKGKSALFIPLPPPILTRRCCVGVKATFRKQQTTQLWMRGVGKVPDCFDFRNK